MFINQFLFLFSLSTVGSGGNKGLYTSGNLKLGQFFIKNLELSISFLETTTVSNRFKFGNIYIIINLKFGMVSKGFP